MSVRISFDALAWAGAVTGSPENPSPKLLSSMGQCWEDWLQTVRRPGFRTWGCLILRDLGQVTGHLQVCFFCRVESVRSVTSRLL